MLFVFLKILQIEMKTSYVYIFRCNVYAIPTNFLQLGDNFLQIYSMETESSRFHPYFVWIKIMNNKNINPQFVHPY